MVMLFSLAGRRVEPGGDADAADARRAPLQGQAQLLGSALARQRRHGGVHAGLAHVRPQLFLCVCIYVVLIRSLLTTRHSPELMEFMSRCVTPRVGDRATAHELLQSAFIQRAEEQGTIPQAQGQVPRLTALAQELNVQLPEHELNIISSIIAEERYAILLYRLWSVCY